MGKDLFPPEKYELVMAVTKKYQGYPISSNHSSAMHNFKQSA